MQYDGIVPLNQNGESLSLKEKANTITIITIITILPSVDIFPREFKN